MKEDCEFVCLRRTVYEGIMGGLLNDYLLGAYVVFCFSLVLVDLVSLLGGLFFMRVF